jgi:hypothetical protein
MALLYLVQLYKRMAAGHTAAPGKARNANIKTPGKSRDSNKSVTARTKRDTRSPKAMETIPHSWTRVIAFAGLRGAVSIALALSLPETRFKNMIVAMTFGVALLSLVV